MHTPAPATEYVPAGHIDAVALVDPATHANPATQLPLQLADDIAAVAPYRPAAHADVHAAVVRPVVFPNRPAGQSTHTPAPDKLYRPIPHTAAVGLADRATQKYPAVQFPLHVAFVMAATPPNKPAGQSEHTPAPGKLY